ncbi:MAG: VOC family protein, partial [Chitinophagales bacterium]
MANDETIGSPLQAEPVLAVKDVTETVMYWHNMLGFTDKWTWGEPPTYAGVFWNGASIQFSQNPKLASMSKGNSILVRVKNLESLYQFHKEKNIEIVEALENKPWGGASYTVREINGYYIIFGGA